MMERGRGALDILFVFACLADADDELDTVSLLARHLDPNEYRIHVIACFHEAGTSEQHHARLEALGVDIDPAPYDLSFDETVNYLAQKIPSFALIISCQNVADIYPALDRLYWQPPLIEYGRLVAHALAGPKHFTRRYVGTSSEVRDAAASRMIGREQHAILIPPVRDFPTDARIITLWEKLLDEVLEDRLSPPPVSIFQSFLQGGFECSTHKRSDGRRLDLLVSTGHSTHAEADYRQLASYHIRTVRDGLRWHLIEGGAGQYDWSSFLPMLRAAKSCQMQVIWDLLHYGWPDDIDIWTAKFVDQFAGFARAVAKIIRDEMDDVPFYCPVNEISFHAWAGGEAAYFNPHARGRGFELKCQLARAAIAAMNEILLVDPRARFVHCEPAINIVPEFPSNKAQRAEAEGRRVAQFQAFDMIAGRLWPQLGGEEKLLDIIGLNYYPNNQWILDGPAISSTHGQYRPFRIMLTETYARYGRPILISETGAEGDNRGPWFRMIAAEAKAARNVGIPVEGICYYPIIDHLGWDDDRDCRSGLLSKTVINGQRGVHLPLAQAMGII